MTPVALKVSVTPSMVTLKLASPCHSEAQGMFVIQIRDWGQSFDPAVIPEPNVDAPLEERPLGGLGLFLIRQSMDDVQFTFDPEHGNELRMEKRLRVEG